MSPSPCQATPAPLPANVYAESIEQQFAIIRDFLLTPLGAALLANDDSPMSSRPATSMRAEANYDAFQPQRWRLPMALATHHSVDVPGATLHYEISGSGPVLMLIGHPMGCSGFAALVPLLVNDYTVVTYDPRGFGRSTIADRDQDAEPDLLADDVRRVLEAVSDRPAHVFGSSGGAVTGLALVARHPDRAGTLVAHEPPLALLLPEVEEARANFHAIYDTYRASGSGAAWQRFLGFTGLNVSAQGANAAPQPPSPEMVATSERFFTHGLLPITLYQPDLAGLQSASTRIVIAGGTTSAGAFPQRTAAALAEHLGTPLIDFPGGHVGFTTNTKEFAAVLRRTLELSA
jgi:pimeloyl-ACP methyl ester carboxylesterase